ncbi:hypothetical protein GGR67_002640 [Xanthomonas arboricola]|nr:hypothetical protein [Xanthomonas euroxanthea]
MTEPLRPPLSRLWLPDQDGGMALQLSASIEGREHAVLTVLADARDESLWVAVQADGAQVQIPLAVLRQLLEVAPVAGGCGRRGAFGGLVRTPGCGRVRGLRRSTVDGRR